MPIYNEIPTIPDDDCLYTAMQNAPVKPPKKNKKIEADIQKQIAKVFELAGFEVVRYNSGKFQIGNMWFNCYYNYNSGMNKGRPDLEIKKNNISISIEVKKPEGKLSDDQKTYIENSKKYRNITLVMKSKTDAQMLVKYCSDNDSIISGVQRWRQMYE